MMRIVSILIIQFLISLPLFASEIEIDLDDNGYIDVEFGGSNAGTASGARTNLGVAIGSDVQAWDSLLDDILGLTLTNGDILYYNGTHIVQLDSGTANYVLQANGAAAPSWSGSLSVSAIDLTDADLNAKLYEVIKTSDATLTDKEVSGTSITNYAETDDADLILTGPDIDTAPGRNFILTIVTAMATYDMCFKASADNLINLDGTAGADNGCVCNSTPTAGDTIACYGVTTGASVADWMCKTITGTTWAAVADATGSCPD